MFITQFLTIATIHLLAVMGPGPDFMMITRNSLVYSRRAGKYSAVGLGLGILVHVFYSIVGIGLIISKSILLFSFIKMVGAAYLVYVGYKSLTAKSSKAKLDNVEEKKDLAPIEALKMGFITNVTNPKVTLFFLSVFTQVIDPGTPLSWQILYGLEMSLATMAWFILVATAFTHRSIKNRVSGIQHYAEKAMGVILIALGIKLALSKAN